MDLSWGALALALTAVGGVLTWTAWRRRGVVAALRGLAWTLLPLAAWLTGTLELVGDLAGDVSHWALHLVFSPAVWLGTMLAGASAVLFVTSGFLRARKAGTRASTGADAVETGPAGLPQPSGKGLPRRSNRHSYDIEGMDEIEAILKKHGI